jgi:hypothetical protein
MLDKPWAPSSLSFVLSTLVLMERNPLNKMKSCEFLIRLVGDFPTG